jgi:hypothetical protein
VSPWSVYILGVFLSLFVCSTQENWFFFSFFLLFVEEFTCRRIIARQVSDNLWKRAWMYTRTFLRKFTRDSDQQDFHLPVLTPFDLVQLYFTELQIKSNYESIFKYSFSSPYDRIRSFDSILRYRYIQRTKGMVLRGSIIDVQTKPMLFEIIIVQMSFLFGTIAWRSSQHSFTYSNNQSILD